MNERARETEEQRSSHGRLLFFVAVMSFDELPEIASKFVANLLTIN
jgi:hypothetical protein